ncbi:MAG: mucoidy inhibitor MuiA family protein [Phycisphaerales bacterium]|nr:mucoidy inhibitor MuiA family protein [Phycisphaerales bacterium]
MPRYTATTAQELRTPRLNRTLLALSILAFAAPALTVSADAPGSAAPTNGTIESVTVYRGQALVSRRLDVSGPTGLREIVVGELPEQIVPGSIYSEAIGGVEVRSVRYRLRPLAEHVDEEVRRIEKMMRDTTDEIAAIARRRQVAAERKVLLDKLEQFVAPAATLELTHGVLNADTIAKLTTFLMDHRNKLADDELGFGLDERRLAEQADLLNRERAALASGSDRTAREAVVFANITDARGASIRVRYLVNAATWTPSYNVRSDGKREGVTLEYYASIQQTSGEDWGDVAMTLSTATPTLVSRAPALTALRVSLTPMNQQQEAQAGGGKGARSRDELVKQQRQLESTRNMYDNQVLHVDISGGRGPERTQPAIQMKELDQKLNEIACDMQLLDIVQPGRVIKSKSDQPTEDLAVTYQLAARVSLPSRAEQQLVQIAALPLKGEFALIATPVLTEYVYEEARVVNNSTMVLLGGPASAYVNGQFVGHSDVPTVKAGESVTLGLGINSSLRAMRELVDRTENVQGGNRVVEFTYAISLENFGDTATKVRVLDRTPSGRDSEVKVTMGTTSIELSDDKSYEQTDRRKGILRWDVEIPPQSIATSAKSLQYKFKVEYDKGMTLAGLPAPVAVK